MLDPKEEKRFEELRGMCRELKVPAPPEIMIGLQVHDKNGILVFDDVQRGHSWTRNFWNALFMTASGAATTSTGSYGAGYLSLRDANQYWSVTGASAHAWLGPGALQILGSQYAGIVPGISDTAWSIDQDGVQNRIAHGNAAGEFIFNAETRGVATYDAGAHTWTQNRIRIFNNNSGSSITVKEMCLCVGTLAAIERSVLSPTVAVANGAQLTVTYEISMDFSSID
jgi:hypothetical protein